MAVSLDVNKADLEAAPFLEALGGDRKHKICWLWSCDAKDLGVTLHSFKMEEVKEEIKFEI